MTDTNATRAAGSSAPACSTVQLTPEQVQNWRQVLCGIIGPYALIMPVAIVQRMRDRFQRIVDDPANDRRDRKE